MKLTFCGTCHRHHGPKDRTKESFLRIAEIACRCMKSNIAGLKKVMCMMQRCSERSLLGKQNEL